MMKDRGSILSIALIIMFGVYLLGNLLFVINQQHVFDVGLMQDSSLNRQKLLSAGKVLVNGWSDSENEYEFIEWEYCEHQSEPDYVWSDELQVFYQLANMPSRCFSGDQMLRIWLKGLDNIEDRLVIDVIRSHNRWVDGAMDKIELLELSDVGRILVLKHLSAEKQFVLDIAESAVLRSQLMQITDEFYEAVLVFEDRLNTELNVFYVVQKMDELSLSGNEIVTLEKMDVDNSGDALSYNALNDQTAFSWRLNVSGQFDVSRIYNRVLFIGSGDQLIALHLDGRAFWDQRLLYRKALGNKQIIPCLYKTPLKIGEWEVGCESSQKIHYYFVE